MRPWSHFYADVLPVVPAGTPDPTVTHHLRRAAQDFCRRTRAWKESLDAVKTAEGVKVYDLELPPFAELVRLESVTLGGDPVEVWRSGFGSSCGRYAHTTDGKVLGLGFAPAPDQPLVAVASLAPGNMAIGVEDVLFDRYDEVIALGAVARLTGNDIKQAQYELRCNAIKTDLWRGMAATRPRAVPHWF
jgi:hypothetical protein